ncbi:MAG: HEPN domain-containing protein [Candidatus Hatepunaea meridiana]|nr:HEPN domain-containing protein [Candidatus Hatepunaea meridiana]
MDSKRHDRNSKMVLIPLIDFKYSHPSISRRGEVEYEFKCINARLVRFYQTIESPEISKKYTVRISKLQNALEIIENKNYLKKNYLVDVHLLLVSFHLALNHPVSVEYFLYPDEPSSCWRDSITIKYINKPERITVNKQKMEEVEEFCIKLIRMEKTSKRLHNAVFLLLRGLFDSNWVGAYLHWSCALEAIFGRKKSGANTKDLICKRISDYLKDGNFNKERIEEFYNIRSRIVHGQLHLVSDKDSKRNLDKLNELWQIVRACFKKLVESEGYKNLSSEKKREKHFDGTCGVTIPRPDETTV